MSSLTSEKKIAICFIAPKAYPLFRPEVEGVFGGAEVDLFYIAKELARDKRFRVSFIVADYGQPPTQTIENITVIRSLSFHKNPLTGAWQIWRALKQTHADIYLIKTASPGVPLVSWFCRRYNRQFVYRVAHRYECDGTYSHHHFFLGKVFARALRNAKIILSQNTNDKVLLEKTLGIPSLVIPNGHQLPILSPAKRDVILWVGRTAVFKRPDIFIALAQKFPREKFIMICPKATGDRNYEILQQQAAAVSNLEFIAQVPFTEIDGYFQRARVLVNTSDSEGFPNVFIQACKWSVPILSLNVNPDGFLNKYSCGLSCRGDVSQLEQGLKYLLENDHCLELGQNARRYAEKHHDIRKIIEIYKTIFTQFMEGS